VQDFTRLLARLSGTELTDEQITGYAKNPSETKEVKLGRPVTVELRYETIVVEDGKLHIYRDVYDRDTNTEENLSAVLSTYGVTLEQLSEQERAAVTKALQEMSRDAAGRSDAAKADSNNNSNAAGANDNKKAEAKVTRAVKGRKEVVVEIAALKGAMRHDPDILLLGEMREMETIKLALGCASMGMLVFGTLHTNNAAKTVDRIINTFPAEEQNQVRVMLSSCLAGVVAQLLCKKIPKGRCAVHEILLTHEALPNTIRSGQIANIKSIIEGGGADGMITMDNSLMNRVKDGTIEPKEAYMKAAIKATFAPLLKPGDLDAGH
jgi:hypothetical protein